MTVHPAPPEDLAGRVHGFARATQAMVDLGHACRDEDFAATTSCPGWTLQDHLSHVAAVEAYLDGGDHVEVELPERAHVRSEFTEWMEHGVQLRRSRSGREVVAELESVLASRLAWLSDPALTLESPVRGPFESTLALGELLRLRLHDIWVHQQDVREVLGRPGDLDTAAAASFVDGLVQAFPRLVARRVDGLAPGQVVILESTGPVTARAGVRIEHDEDGAALGHALFTGADPHEGPASPSSGETGEDGAPAEGAAQPEPPPAAPPPTTISLSTHALTRRMAGRRSTADTSYRVVGDQELAVRVLDALVVTP